MTGKKPFPIVGVGASAGGVEALEGFFRGMPNEPGLAIVIVTHLNPRRESLLHEVVGHYTRLPIEIASDNTKVEVNHIYVLPAGAILTISDRTLRLEKVGRHRAAKPIDVFFSSLAVDVGEWSAGVVLSGGDGDGTLGIKAIKERGGLTLAQTKDGFGPRHDDMPISAISTGLIDFAVPAEEMGQKLVDFAQSSDLLDELIDQEPMRSGTAVTKLLAEIWQILQAQLGHDFSGYKPKTFLRRVQRRMQVNGVKQLENYVEQLRNNAKEVSALFRDLLINVTNFFRDTDAFAALGKSVVPELFQNRDSNDPIRVWVPGCSTGEEVFSLGMLFREHMDTLSIARRVQIFATDIDDHALGVARAARYTDALMENVSAARRERFFIHDNGSYVVSKEIRDLCIFSSHSVIRDPPFSRIDLVSCRNLMIYFGADIQNQVIPTFHYALRPEGFLFLGTAEGVSQFDDLFIPVEKKHRIFRRRSLSGSSVRVPFALSTTRTASGPDRTGIRGSLGAGTLKQVIEDRVLDRFAPPHVVVNRDGDIIYFSARTGKYLETPTGSPTRQLLMIARKGLRLDLRTMLREVQQTAMPVIRSGVYVENDAGEFQMVTLMVEPIANRGTSEPLYLVLFNDQGTLVSQQEILDKFNEARDGDARHVEAELRETRDRLQSVIEEYETALEELKASNEELVSVNEEMQSTNEELEASKEELQSVNEELHTVNSELAGSVESLDRANNDLQNLFDSTDVATVFLDGHLTIRSFTPAVAKIFNMLPSDIGRPLADLSSNLELSDLADDIRKVLSNGRPIERRLSNPERSSHFLVRVGPYRNETPRIEGVVVTFVDVSSLTRAEARQRVLIAELQHRTRNLLAVVQAVAQETIGKGGSLDSYFERLAALGRVQSLVSNANGEPVDLNDIVRLELKTIGTPTEHKVTIAGPKAVLGFDIVQTMGLALHELVTNAVKYGALKDENGKLDISWTLRARDIDISLLVLDWVESGLSVRPDESRKGFGRELIEQALAFTLRAKTKLTFNPDGIAYRIEVPIPRQD